MTFKNILNKLALTAMGACLLITPSCDYLDVVPDEQVSPQDAMKTYEGALGYLYSVYNKSAATGWGDIPYGDYLSETFCTADDILNPHAWVSDSGTTGSYVLMNTLSATSCRNYWRHNFQGIGQGLAFLKELERSNIVERGIITQAEHDEWVCEAKALMAYYHFIILRRYGPIPIVTEQADFGTPQSDFQGRYHFDYVIDWICNELDEAAKGLPATRENAYVGRMTSTICKAIKAQALFLAASPLWNGSFPYSDWKNTNFETPGYGFDLVSHSYSKEKWQRAYNAIDEAITFAESQGNRKLFTVDDMPTSDGINPDDIYIPQVNGHEVSSDFKRHVLLMQYLTYACETEGNREAIMTTTSDGLTTLWWAMCPRQFMKQNNGNWASGYSGVNPTLNAVKWFLTDNGLTIDNDPDFPDESEWYKSANLPAEGNRRDQIIKLNTQREPRFYAWIGFDGGDYGVKVANGSPIHLNMRSKAAQGMDASARDNSQTGFLNIKHLPPTAFFAVTGSWTGYQWPAKKVIRLAELYLDRAECAAELGNRDQAIRDVNKIRSRAGARALTPSMINDQMTLMDWVRRERAIELFAESARYWDLRRWVVADKYIGLGMRMGLNALEKENPSFEEFNKPVTLPFPYTWGSRLYLYPIPANDLYANPQLVQAPGY